eukprot:2507898-Pleurochrysis_carterae.AAC.5
MRASAQFAAGFPVPGQRLRRRRHAGAACGCRTCRRFSARLDNAWRRQLQKQQRDRVTFGQHAAGGHAAGHEQRGGPPGDVHAGVSFYSHEATHLRNDCRPQCFGDGGRHEHACRYEQRIQPVASPWQGLHPQERARTHARKLTNDHAVGSDYYSERAYQRMQHSHEFDDYQGFDRSFYEVGDESSGVFHTHAAKRARRQDAAMALRVGAHQGVVGYKATTPTHEREGMDIASTLQARADARWREDEERLAALMYKQSKYEYY